MKHHRMLTALLAASALATGLAGGPVSGMCPPAWRERPIEIADPQRVYVYYRAGLEDLILESSYRGQAKDFGMILPVPSVPDVRMVQNGFFDAMTRVAGQFEQFKSEKAAAGRMAEASDDASWRQHVQVVRRQVAGVFNSVTLKATRLDALQKWLDENGYKYSDDDYARKVFQQYIDQQWLFLAVQVKVEAQNETFDGRFRPMGVRFRTKDIVIPTRVASIYPSGMPFEFYVVTNRSVDFPQSWGQGRKVTLPLSTQKILAEPDVMRELESEAFFSATDDLPALAERMKRERADEYKTLLERKLSGLYLSVFTGFFTREQLGSADLVFEGRDLVTAQDVGRCLRDFSSGDIAAVKTARETLEVAGSGHIGLLAAHLEQADSQLRITLSRVLGGLGEPSAVPALIGVLKTEQEPLVKAALQSALRDITGVTSPDFGVKAWEEWWERWRAGGHN